MSPPGSTNAARCVCGQMTSEQFCSNGVTGMTSICIPALSPRRRAGRLLDPECVVLEVCQGDDLQGSLVGGIEDHWRGNTRLCCLSPAAGTEAPVVSGLKPWKSKLGPRGDEVIPTLKRELQEWLCHDGADCVPAIVVLAGVAAPVSKESCEGIEAAGLQRRPQDISGRPRSTRSLGHGQLRSFTRLARTSAATGSWTWV